MHKYIVICGPLSAGKTSLTEILTEAYSWEPIYEDLESNLFFKNFYKDMKKWGFHTAISFLIRAIELQKVLNEKLRKKTICQDWHVLEHHEVYNLNMRQYGILTELEYQVCGRLHRILSDKIIEPNCIIYVKAKATTLLSRVIKRRRKEEIRGLTINYIDNLIKIYSKWIKNIKNQVVQIDTDIYDFVSREEDKQYVLKKITELIEI